MIPESHWREATEDCPEPQLWASPDGMASEYEVSEFMAALVRLLKPKAVIETGCYQGHTSMAIGQALKVNGRGVLHTCDEVLEHVLSLEERVRAAELPVVVHHLRGVECCRRYASVVDLAFIDSAADMDVRKEEMDSLRQGLIVVHDARDFAQVAGPPVLFIPTPRGLAIYQK